MKASLRTQYACAVLLIGSSIALAFLQVLSINDIAGGTLIYIAQAFMLAGSIFGLGYTFQKLYFKYINNGYDNKRNPEQ